MVKIEGGTWLMNTLKMLTERAYPSVDIWG